MRVSSSVTPEDCRHAADTVDPTAPGYGEHLPFHSILQRCGVAWRDYLATLGIGTGVIVPRLTSDFLAEVQVGTLDIDVSTTAVGTTSFTVSCEVSQDGAACAHISVVLVNFDYLTRRPVPLDARQRARLEQEIVA